MDLIRVRVRCIVEFPSQKDNSPSLVVKLLSLFVEPPSLKVELLSYVVKVPYLMVESPSSVSSCPLGHPHVNFR